MGWLDGDVDIGDYDFGGSDGYQSVLDSGAGGYAAPDTSWAYGGEDWTPTITDYGGGVPTDVGYDYSGGGGGLTMGGGGGGGALGYSQPASSAIGTPQTLAGANSGYSLGSTGKGITDVAEKAAAPERSITDKALGLLKDKDGDFDAGKIMKLVTAVGGLYQASQKQNTPAGSQTAAQLQQQLVQKHNDWTPQQAVWANNFLNTPINPNRPAGPVAGAGGIKSIIPSRGYASGGGIGAVGDERYGNRPARRLPEVPDTNIWEFFRRKNEQESGLRGEPEVLQEGNTPRISSEMYSPGEIMRSILQLMGGRREEYAEGGSVDDRALLSAFKDQQSAESGAVPLLSLLAELAAAKHLPSRLAQVGGGAYGMMDGGGVINDGPLSNGTFGLIQGEGDGQTDSVPIDAAPGEYMFDAETVSMLGNGSNEAGAQILDQWRQNLREQKRGAPLDEIAPESDHPDEYLPGEQ